MNPVLHMAAVGYSVLAILAGSVASATAAPKVPRISVADFGARGDDTEDDTAAIRAALAEAAGRSPAAEVLLPAGRYRYTGIIEVDGLVVRGEGAGQTVLEATDRLNSAWRLTGKGGGLHDLSLRTLHDAGPRETTPATTGVEVAGATHFILRGLRIGPVASAGIFVRESGGTNFRPALIEDCEVVGTLADGIHLTGGSAFIEVTGNRVRGSGDDGIAVVSYRDNELPCQQIRIADNQVEQGGARGISVVGGMDVVIERNRIAGTQVAGVLIASESGYDTYPVARVRVLDNRLEDTVAVSDSGHGAIHVEGRKPLRADQLGSVNGVVLRGNRISGTSRAGIRIGPNVTEVRIRGNHVAGAAGAGMAIGPFTAEVEIGGPGGSADDGNTIESCGSYGVQVDPNGTAGQLAIRGNHFQAVNTRGRSFVDVIHIGKGGDYPGLSIVSNRFTQAPGTTVERFIQCLVEGARISSNTIVEPAEPTVSAPPAAAPGR